MLSGRNRVHLTAAGTSESRKYHRRPACVPFIAIDADSTAELATRTRAHPRLGTGETPMIHWARRRAMLGGRDRVHLTAAGTSESRKYHRRPACVPFIAIDADSTAELATRTRAHPRLGTGETPMIHWARRRAMLGGRDRVHLTAAGTSESRKYHRRPACVLFIAIDADSTAELATRTRAHSGWAQARRL